MQVIFEDVLPVPEILSKRYGAIREIWTGSEFYVCCNLIEEGHLPYAQPEISTSNTHRLKCGAEVYHDYLAMIAPS